MVGVFDVALCATFVAGVVVHDAEEGLTWLSFPPAEFIATLPAFVVVSPADVVVGFATVVDVVARFAEVVGVVFDFVVGDVAAATHRVRAGRDRMQAGDPGASRGGADGRVGEAVFVEEPLAGEFVDIGRVRPRVAIAAYPVNVVVLAGEPKDVRAFECGRGGIRCRVAASCEDRQQGHQQGGQSMSGHVVVLWEGTRSFVVKDDYGVKVVVNIESCAFLCRCLRMKRDALRGRSLVFRNPTLRFA